MAASQRQYELTQALRVYASAYYNNDAPLISDYEYDEIYDELKELEESSGEVLEGSPTRKVGGEVARGFLPHRHIGRLWSLNKARNFEELLEWEKRVQKLRQDSIAQTGRELPNPSYALEYKFDGLTLNLTYENGKLVQAATRGNGETGEGILEQIRTIADVPQTIAFAGRLEVQGEGYMKLSVLEELNKQLNEPLKNARNAAAGALRNLDVAVTKSRRLSCFCYNIGYIEGKAFTTQHEMRAFLLENGFPVSDYFVAGDHVAELFPYLHEAEEKRHELDFLIDGMVIKLTPAALREALGYTQKFPHWAIAYKFAAEEATTKIEDITWEVGRTGKLTPLAHLKPVELSGATIRRATLNNFDDIIRKNVGIGSTVFLRRSNDVIPEILGSVPGDQMEQSVEKPRLCPACGAHVEQRGAHIYCTNSLSCRPQIVGRVKHFASRDAMDIETLADKTAGRLIDELGLTAIPQLYELKPEQLMALEGFKTKKMQNLLAAIEKSKSCSLGRFLYALGIPNVGSKTARDLARFYGTLENVRNADTDSLIRIEDVGEIVADSVVTFFLDARISAQIDALLTAGVTPEPEETSQTKGPLVGKTVVVTGTLSTMDRRAAEQLIFRMGGKAANSVSKNTDYVLAGENAGSKLEKALALFVPVLSEQEFLALVAEEK